MIYNSQFRKFLQDLHLTVLIYTCPNIMLTHLDLRANCLNHLAIATRKSISEPAQMNEQC